MVEKEAKSSGRRIRAESLPDQPTLKHRIKKDPAIDRLADAASTGRPLGFMAYRRFLAGFEMVSSEERTALNFGTLSQTLRAVTRVDLGFQKADVLFTRSTAFLVFDSLPDFGNLKQMAPDVSFPNRASIASSGTRQIFIIQLNGAELSAVLAISALSMPERAEQDQKGVPQEAMPIGENTLRETESLKRRMKDWIVEHQQNGFSFSRFRRDIRIAREFTIEKGSQMYVVALEDDSVYSITYFAPWKGEEKPQNAPHQPICWLNDGGKLYMVQKEEFIGAPKE